jgi:cysteine-rich repeat protein
MGQETCDDGNLLNYDGCSSQCQIEADFKCSSSPFNSTSKYNTSTCFYTKKITFKLVQIHKVLGENKVQIYIKLPIVPVSGWSNIDFSKIVKLTGEALPGIKSTFLQVRQDIQTPQRSNRINRIKRGDFKLRTLKVLSTFSWRSSTTRPWKRKK